MTPHDMEADLAIERFDGEYRWLSNFYPAAVTLDGVIYPTVEHAYQAAKTLDRAERLGIGLKPTPGQAKRAGRHVTLRPDWDAIKVDVMEGLLRQKFSSADLRNKLVDTGEEMIVEGNTWGDTFWGVCRGEGKNTLGRLLMLIRHELVSGAWG
jgi:N-glycosidase YbiA